MSYMPRGRAPIKRPQIYTESRHKLIYIFPNGLVALHVARKLLYFFLLFVDFSVCRNDVLGSII